MYLVTAQRAVALAKGKIIPVRCNVAQNNGCGGAGHRSRGVLIALRGKKLVIKPHGHGKTELYLPKHVALWKSRIIDNGLFTREQVDEMSKPVVKKTKSTPVVVTEISDMSRRSEKKARQRRAMIAQQPAPPQIVPEDQALADRIADSEEIFVIADASRIKEGVLRFYMGAGTKTFTNDLASASNYNGDMARTNAMKSVGQLKRRTDAWTTAGVDIDQLCVLSTEHVARIISEPRQTPKVEPVVEAPAPAPASKPVVEATVETPAPLKAESEISPRMMAALNKIRASQQNMHAIIDMLHEERKTLIEARDNIVAVVSEEINLVDSVIAGTKSAMGDK